MAVGCVAFRVNVKLAVEFDPGAGVTVRHVLLAPTKVNVIGPKSEGPPGRVVKAGRGQLTSAEGAGAV